MHPEYFALMDGQRREGPTRKPKLCLGNPGLRKLFVQRVLQFAEANPDALSLSGDPSDGTGHCACELCRAMDDPDDPPELRDPKSPRFNASNRVCRFNNLVARELARGVPGARLHWLAYGHCQRPPSVVSSLEPNTIIQFSSMTHLATGLYWNDYSKRLHDPTDAPNKAFLDLAKAWHALGPSAAFTYEYWTSSYAWPGPLPVTRMVADRVRSYPELGIRGVWNETGPHWGPQGIDIYRLTFNDFKVDGATLPLSNVSLDVSGDPATVVVPKVELHEVVIVRLAD